ncbi:ankyrin repeat-containing protein [European chub iridovirus]|nr:ankyrin repeat-containing protein [European chub iridovirus]
MDIFSAFEDKNIEAFTNALIQNPSKIDNFKHGTQMTALGMAVNANMLAFVQLLLHHNADPNMECEMGLPLQMATYHLDLFAVFKTLLDSPQIDVNKCDLYGMSTLHVACINNNVKAVEALVDYGAHVNINNNDFETPIFYCMKNVSLFHLMYMKGKANINIVNSSNESPLEFLFNDVNDEDMKFNVVKPIYDVIVNELREPIHMSATSMAYVLECEDIMPPMFERVVCTATSIDLTSPVYTYGYNCQTLSIHLGLIHVLDKIMQITKYDPRQDAKVPFVVFNIERPESSFDMLKYLLEDLNVNVLYVMDDSGFPPAYYALTDKCTDCFLFLMERTPRNVEYDLAISKEMAYAALRTESMQVIKTAVKYFDFLGKIHTPLNMFHDTNAYTHVISAYLGTMLQEKANTEFIRQALLLIIHEQGLPDLVDAPMWFKSSSLYNLVKQYDTLMYRSLASVDVKKKNDADVQRFKRFRKCY